jgi:hypothetical protein
VVSFGKRQGVSVARSNASGRGVRTKKLREGKMRPDLAALKGQAASRLRPSLTNNATILQQDSNFVYLAAS